MVLKQGRYLFVAGAGLVKVRSLRETLFHNLDWADEIFIWVGNNIYPIT